MVKETSHEDDPQNDRKPNKNIAGALEYNPKKLQPEEFDIRRSGDGGSQDPVSMYEVEATTKM